MTKLRLKLYISGRTARTEQAVANLRLLLDRPGTEYELTVHDVLEDPRSAEEDKVIATPTLIRESPLPAVRIIGDIAEPAKALGILDLPGVRQG